jgi:hypothetical protein
MSAVVVSTIIPVIIVTGIVLFLASFILARGDKSPVRDHAARSAVTAGIGFISVGVALFVFEQNSLRSDRLRDDQQYQSEQERQNRQVEADRQRREQEALALDHDRQLTSQNFYSAMLLYSFVALRLFEARLDCGMEKTSPKLDRNLCREASAVAARSSGSLPSIDSILRSSTKGSKGFIEARSVVSDLMDGEATLRARMPVVIDSGITQYIDTARASSVAAKSKFSSLMLEIQNRAEDTGKIYCMLTSSSSESWKAFDGAVARLEDVLSDVAAADRSTAAARFAAAERRSGEILELVSNIAIGKFQCSNILESARAVFTDGGGNGGGG